MIAINNLSFSYDTEKVLGPLDLNIPKHTTCAIIGPSGCGKTTLLRLLSGFLKGYEGEIIINNAPLTGIRKDTGVILQSLGLLPWKTVYNNIALGLWSRGISKTSAHEVVMSILDELGLTPYAQKYPAELSGGQKQRVAIGRTLVLDPDLLLLDEATSALDELNKENIQKLILNLYKNHPMTLIFITHSIEEAVFLGQNIIIMDKGCIRHQISNPLFGDELAKENIQFYEKCLEIRKLMKVGEANEK